MNFEALYHQHKRMVYNLALSYLQNHEDAQEVTQDVFVSVHQSIEGFNKQSTFSTWIYRITINKALDFIRAKNRKKRFAFFSSLFHENSGEVKYESVGFDHPGVELENKEALENIFAQINTLPENQKTALILSKIEKLSQVEVAEIMNLSAKAVESLLGRAKENLMKKLNERRINEN
ncbi:MAG: RNA polymerase sigma factor [Bacteroidetes bacterium]|nr:RNA polymerase sigma factor [Bacteroidota bacterium]